MWHVNLSALETLFGGNGNRRQREFLSEQEKKTGDLEMWESHKE